MLFLVELYQREFGVGTVDLDEDAQWAIGEGHYRPEPIDPAKVLKGQDGKSHEERAHHRPSGSGSAKVARCTPYRRRAAVDVMGNDSRRRSEPHANVTTAAKAIFALWLPSAQGRLQVV
jgi:hypothetical protein